MKMRNIVKAIAISVLIASTVIWAALFVLPGSVNVVVLNIVMFPVELIIPPKDIFQELYFLSLGMLMPKSVPIALILYFAIWVPCISLVIYIWQNAGQHNSEQ